MTIEDRTKVCRKCGVRHVKEVKRCPRCCIDREDRDDIKKILWNEGQVRSRKKARQERELERLRERAIKDGDKTNKMIEKRRRRMNELERRLGKKLST